MLIGDLTVWPDERVLAGPNGTASVEPLVMALLLELASRADTLVTRPELFTRLWGSLAIGDDNLNRLVAALRRTLNGIGVASVGIKTVPAAGYSLRLEPHPSRNGADADVLQAISEARDSWRLSLPQPDHLRLSLLERAAQLSPEDPEVFGHLALLHRHAAEYAEPAEASKHVRSCEMAARRALDLDPANVRAATALVSVAPLYGRWFEATRRLSELCAGAPDDPVPQNDLSVVEMATGQTHAAKRRRDRLIAADPLAAQFQYKSVYQHWSVGDLVRMDHVADSAMQLWPLHPAVWTVRLWTLAYTGRFAAAQVLLAGRRPPGISEPLSAFLRQIVAAAMNDRQSAQDEAAMAATAFASGGSAHAVAALLALGLFSRTDEAFAVARRYYLQDGNRPVPVQPQADHPTLNEQHRRLTQILFTPACAHMRPDPRFLGICNSIGLTEFWERSGLTPDFMR
jgi:DNA-binding winged helix-turn-helix (wHTH) protein